MRRGWILGFACGAAAACSAGAGGDLVGGMMQDVGAVMEDAGGAVREAGEELDGTAHADDGGGATEALKPTVLNSDCLDTGDGFRFATFDVDEGSPFTAIGCFVGGAPPNALRCNTAGAQVDGSTVRVRCAGIPGAPEYESVTLYVLR